MGEDVLKGVLGATAGKESGDPKDVFKHRDESSALPLPSYGTSVYCVAVFHLPGGSPGALEFFSASSN